MIALPAWALRLLGIAVEVAARQLCQRGQGAEVQNRIDRARAAAERKERLRVPFAHGDLAPEDERDLRRREAEWARTRKKKETDR